MAMLAEKTVIKPEDDIFFACFVIQGTEQEIKKAKQSILLETSVKLIYQYKGIRYPKISTDKTSPETVSGTFYSTPPL